MMALSDGRRAGPASSHRPCALAPGFHCALAALVLAAALFLPAGPAWGQVQAPLVEGFRSAKFGADEKAVRAAIKADFGIDGKAVRTEQNAIEKTNALVFEVDGLEPGGRAQLAYILGYTSKKLIQVNVVWGMPTNPGATIDQLTGAAVLLRNYFTQQAFAPERRVADQRLPDGSLLYFQGADAKGRIVSLQLLPLAAPVKAGEEKPKLVYSLRLSYIADLKAPDIFQLKPGSF
jgi:hypothetical protein